MPNIIQHPFLWTGTPGLTETTDHLAAILASGDNRGTIHEYLSHPADYGITNNTVVELCIQMTFDTSLFLVVIGTPLAVAAHYSKYTGHERLINRLLDHGLTWRTDTLTELYLSKRSIKKVKYYARVQNPEYYLLLQNLSEDLKRSVLEDMRHQSGIKKSFGRGLLAALQLPEDWHTPMLADHSINERFSYAISGSQFDMLDRLIGALHFIQSENTKCAEAGKADRIIPLCQDFLARTRKSKDLLPVGRSADTFPQQFQIITDTLFMYYSQAILEGHTMISDAAKGEIQGNLIVLKPAQLDNYLRRKVITALVDHPVNLRENSMINRMLDLCKTSRVSRIFLLRYLTKDLWHSSAFDAFDLPLCPGNHLLGEEETRQMQHVLDVFQMDVHQMLDAVWGNRTAFGEFNGFEYVFKTSPFLLLNLAYDINQKPVILSGESEVEMSLLDTLIDSEFSLADPKSFRDITLTISRTLDHVEPDNKQESLWKHLVKTNSPELLTLAIQKNILPRSALESMADYAAENDCFQVIPFLYAGL